MKIYLYVPSHRLFGKNTIYIERMGNSIMTIQRVTALFAMVFLFLVDTYAQSSLTDNATAWASSSIHHSAWKVLDKDFQTQWISEAPFPNNYIKRHDLNILLHQNAGNSSGLSHPERLTDGNLSLLTNVNSLHGEAWITYNFEPKTPMLFLQLKAKTAQNIDIYVYSSANDSLLVGQYSAHNNYQIIKLNIPEGTFEQLKLISNAPFQIFEIAAVAELPKEYVAIDLGEEKWIGAIEVRHWAGNNAAISTGLYISSDSIHWTLIQNLDPNQFSVQNIILPHPVHAQYIKVEHTITDANYVACYVWEIEAYEYQGSADNNEDDYSGGSDNNDDHQSGFWDPYAGIMPSYTDHATITASSTANNSIPNLTDANIQTQWTSNYPLPHHYLSRADQNYLRGILPIDINHLINPTYMTDGHPATATVVNIEDASAAVELSLSANIQLQKLHIKARAEAAIQIYKVDASGTEQLVGIYETHHNYSIKDFGFIGMTDKIKLTSTASFLLFEVAGIKDAPKEWVIADFGESKELGVVKTRHWAGNQVASAVQLFHSQDGQNWQFIDNLDPNAMGSVTTILKPTVNARYIKLEYTLNIQDYAKVYAWELDAYDRHGEFGSMPLAKQSKISLAQLLGINTIWGWGHEKYADQLAIDQGPHLHKNYASHTRFYRNLDWDLLDPDNPVNFDAMASGNGTEAKWWLNWNREFQSVIDADMTLSNTIKLDNFTDTQWDDPYGSAYDYAYKLAAYFGPTLGNGQIHQIEIGNEPWAYDSETYRQILRGMADGIKDADSTIKVLPCALQAFDEQSAANTNFSNWMGDKLSEVEANLLDGLNIHTYSYATNDQGERIGIHPESIQSTMRELLSTLRFRDANMPGKPIYLTEWGWDSDGGGEDCTHAECVSEQAAAAYATRGALMAMRLGIEQTTWYLYGNFGNSIKWSRSGTTSSKNAGFQKKRTFFAFESLVNLIGDKYFIQTAQEDDTAWIYLMGDEDGQPTHLVAWRPINGNDTSTIHLEWPTNYSATAAFQINGYSRSGSPINIPPNINGKLHLSLSAMPIVVELNSSSHTLAKKHAGVNKKKDQILKLLNKNEFYSNNNLEDFSRPNVSVYPNPSTAFIHVDVDTQSPKFQIIRIFDWSGRTVYQEHFPPKNEIRIDLKTFGLLDGSYILQLLNEKELLHNEKIIVQNSF